MEKRPEKTKEIRIEPKQSETRSYIVGDPGDTQEHVDKQKRKRI